MAIPDPIPSVPDSDISWAVETAYNGVNESVNKVATITRYKDYGWGYTTAQDQPQRNAVNWWKNAVYLWIKYIQDYINLRVKRVADSFSYNPSSVTGLKFTVNTGYFSDGSKLINFPATEVTMADNDTNYVIAYVALNGAATVSVVQAYPDLSTEYSWQALYIVTTSGGAITDIQDVRTQNTIRKATPDEVIAGTDNTKYITPYSLDNGIIIPSATTSIYGKMNLAANADISDQGSVNPDSLLNVTSLASTQIRATDAKYGLTCYANTYDLTPANRGVNTTFALTVGSMDNPQAYATETAAGFVRKAAGLDPTDSTSYVTPAMLADAASLAMPTGSITEWASETPPSGWLECDGSTVANSGDTAALYVLVGSTYGSLGKLPDLRGEFIRGFVRDRTTGLPTSEYSRQFGSFQDDLYQAHTHPYNDRSTGEPLDAGGGQPTATDRTGTTGATGGSETRPRNITVIYIIKK